MLPFLGLLFWISIIIVIALILGVVAALIALPLAKKPKRKRKILLAFLSPGVAIGIYTICSVVTMLTTSALCNVDIGLGDTWISPLPNDYHIYSYDLPGNGQIDKMDTSDSITTFYETVSASKLQVIGDTVIGQQSGNHGYFLLDTRTDSLTVHENLAQLQASLNGKKIELMDTGKYHWQARRVPYSIGVTIALCCIALALYLLWKIGLSSRWDKLYQLMTPDSQEKKHP